MPPSSFRLMHLEAAEQTAPPAERTADSITETMMAELVQEWGDDADTKLGIIQSRLLRVEDAADMSAAWASFDALPSGHAKAILKELAQ